MAPFIQVSVNAGKTTTLSAPVFLPRVDPATEVAISSPADHEIVLRHAAIPGLEVHVPKGVVLRTYDGKIVTKLSITPIPVDRAPYGAPIPFSVYFTLQPGGSYVDGDPSKSIKIIYPNYQGLPAGSPVTRPAGGRLVRAPFTMKLRRGFPAISLPSFCCRNANPSA